LIKILRWTARERSQGNSCYKRAYKKGAKIKAYDPMAMKRNEKKNSYRGRRILKSKEGIIYDAICWGP